MPDIPPDAQIPASDFYARRTAELRAATNASLGTYSRYTQTLIALGLLACLLLYQSVVAKSLPLWSASLVLPVAVLVEYKRRLSRLNFMKLRSLSEFYDKGFSRITQNWERLDGGDEFLDQDHLYAKDLDLFGRGSLYQLLCSARTQIGRQTLANWMTSPASVKEVQLRQAAISELRACRSLPELLVAAAPMQISDFRPGFLKAWVTENSLPFPAWSSQVAFLLAITAIALPVLYFSGLFASTSLWRILCALLVLQAVFAISFRPRVKSVLESLGSLSIELPVMRALLQIMEREQFSSQKLTALANSFRRSKPVASSMLHRLHRLIRLVKLREDELFAYPSFCLLWGTQFAMAIDRWRRRHGLQMLEWMASLGEVWVNSTP